MAVTDSPVTPGPTPLPAVEDLLSCLEADPCATKVLELVAPTFFPGSDEGDFDLLVALLRESEDAGVALCRAVAHSLASGKGRGKRRGPAVTPEVADAAAATLLSTLLAHRPAGQAAPAAEVRRAQGSPRVCFSPLRVPRLRTFPGEAKAPVMVDAPDRRSSGPRGSGGGRRLRRARPSCQRCRRRSGAPC